MKLFIYILVTAVFFSLVCFVLLKLYLNEKKKTKELKDEIDKQKRNVAFLVRNAEAMQSIRNEKERVVNQIVEAKTDEEIADIVGAIVDANNSRVRNDNEG